MDCEEFDKVGLKPSSKTPLLNGSIECSLREYVMFDGRYNDFRSEGGSIKSYDEPEEHGPRKMKRLSDDEWRRETRKFGQHDRKPQKHEDRNASYRRDDRRDGGYRDDRRDDFKPRGGKPGRKDFNDKRSENKPYTPKRPTISEDKSQVINPVHFRKRKQK